MSDRPASEIIPKKDDEIYTEEDYDDLEETLFDEGQIDEIIAPDSEEEEYRRNLFFDRDTQEQKGNVVLFLDPKQSRKMIKQQPEMLYEIKEMKKEKRRSDNMMMNKTYPITEEINNAWDVLNKATNN